MFARLENLQVRIYLYVRHLKFTKRRKFYAAASIVFLILSIGLIKTVFFSAVQSMPRGSFWVGLAPTDQTVVNETNVSFDISSQIIDIQTTFGFLNTSGAYSISALIPYTIDKVLPYIGYGNIFYSPSDLTALNQTHPLPFENCSKNFSSENSMSVVNATFQLNPSFDFNQKQITVEIVVGVKENLIALKDSLDEKQTAIFSFFGTTVPYYFSGLNYYPYIQEAMSSNEGWKHLQQGDFSVSLRLPSSYYFSGSQPAPVQYYVEDSYFNASYLQHEYSNANNPELQIEPKWTDVVFSLNFNVPSTAYGLITYDAQTVSCSFTSDSIQSVTELSIFILGVFVTLTISFSIEFFSPENTENRKKFD